MTRILLLLAALATEAMAADRPALPAPAAAVAPVTFAYERFVLPNGLTVLVYTDHAVPTIHVGVRYRTGSRDEPPGRTGFAHLFEHLMFGPTAHRGGEYFTPLRKAGATDMNGSTDLDQTDYFETVPTAALDLALWMESDRMGYLDGGISQAGLDGQRAVVENEKRQREAGPGGTMQARFDAGFYPPGHPYAHSTMGSVADLDQATLDDVRAWFRDHYGAGNAVLVLAGDIDAKTAREKALRYFGAIRPGMPVSRPLQWVPSFTEDKREVVYEPGISPGLSRTWPLPNDDPRETTLLQLVARSLAGSDQTPLHRALVEERKVATAVTASVADNAVTSNFVISLALRPGVSPEAAGRALDAALADYIAKGPDPERLQVVVGATDRAMLRMLESNAAVADFLLGGEVDHGDPGYFLKQRRWIGEAKGAELRALAAKWLVRPYYEMQTLPPPAFAAAATDVDRSAPPRPVADEGRIAFPPITETVLPNGLKLVVARRPRAAMVDMEMRFATGSLADSGYAPGTASRAFALMPSASRGYDAAALARQKSLLGTGMAGSVGDRDGAFAWSATTVQLDRSFALAADVLRHPLYPQAALDQVAADVAERAGAYERDPVSAGDALFARAVQGGEEAERPAPGEQQKVTRDMVLRFHDREIGPNDATLYMIGDIAPETARRLAERYFGDWQPVSPTPLPDVPVPHPAARIILVDAPGAAQSGITVGGLVPPFDPARSAGEALVNATLAGGFGSRLNLDLRNRGWSYGFTGGIDDAPAGPRLFTASGTVQTDRTAAAIAAIRDQIAAFTTSRPMTADELEAARGATVRALPGSFTGNSGFLASMVTSAAYHLPYDRAASVPQRLAAVTLDEARGIARQFYRPDALTWVVIGDLALIERDVRALGIAPVEVWDVHGRRLR